MMRLIDKFFDSLIWLGAGLLNLAKQSGNGAWMDGNRKTKMNVNVPPIIGSKSSTIPLR